MANFYIILNDNSPFLDSETNKVIDEFDELISIPEGFFEEKEDNKTFEAFETESMESLNISQSTANTTLIIVEKPDVIIDQEIDVCQSKESLIVVTTYIYYTN